jgi:hypothetical protein
VSKLPTTSIPVSVDTRGVDSGVRHIQHKMAGLQKKLQKMGGPIGGGKATGLLSGVGGLGVGGRALGMMGAGGAAAAAPMALAMVARKHVEEMARMTKGATAALESFKQTGEQSFAVNSQVLRLMAEQERSAQAAAQLPGMGTAFKTGMMGIDQGGQGILEQISEFSTVAAGFLGKFLSGGGVRESAAFGQLQATTDENVAAQLAAEIRDLEQKRMRGEVDMFSRLFGGLNFQLEQLSIMIGKRL